MFRYLPDAEQAWLLCFVFLIIVCACTCHGCVGVCVHAMVVWVSEELSPYTVDSGDQIRLSGMVSCAHTYLQANSHT